MSKAPPPTPPQQASGEKPSQHQKSTPTSTNAPADVDTIKAEVEQQEQLLTTQLDQRFKTMQLESQRLAHAKRELEKMGFDHRKDIDMLRAKIETNSRDLSYANSHLRQKVKEHKEAALEVERLSTSKNLLIEHLRVIIYDNEKKKKKKLAELMSSLGTTAGVAPAAAAPAAAAVSTAAAQQSSTTVAPQANPPPAPARTSSWTGF